MGGRVTDWDVTMGDGFGPCPVAEALGIPLLVKRERGTGEECFIQLARRLMYGGSTLARWQYSGMRW